MNFWYNKIKNKNMITLKDLVNYQVGAVVSKEILKTEQGTITLFAFDAGQALTEHTTPFKALVQVIDGEAEIIIDKVEHILLEGQIIELPANTPHAVKAEKQFKMLLTMIKN